MEIGKISLKYRILLAILTAIIHTFLLWGFDYFTNEKLYSTNSLIFQGIGMGFFFGFGLPYVNKKLGSKLTGIVKINPELELNEQVEIEDPANLFRGIEGVGGKLFLTNKKLIFKAHKINIQKGQTNIEYTNIKDVVKLKTLKLINNGIRIITKSGTKYDFVVNERNLWLEKINNQIKTYNKLNV